MEEPPQAGLKFHLFDVFKILFERGTPNKGYVYNININNALIVDEENPNLFQVFFHINIGSKDEDKPLNIQVEAVGYFELTGDIPEDVVDNYKNISAPSIVYPYIRAFLSNLTLLSGLNPINLPPINFVTKQTVDGNNEELKGII